jgi:hypothetical protein
MPSSVSRLVRQDHERLSRLLRRVCAPGPSQARWRTEFLALLAAHRTAEREELLPAAGGRGPSGAALDGAPDDAPDDELDRLAAELADAGRAPADVAELCRRAQEALDRHADGVAARALSVVEESLPRKELRHVGGRYAARRDGELARGGAHQAPPRRLDLSRAELYEMARRAGIPGRAAMSREQLIEELQRRPHP